MVTKDSTNEDVISFVKKYIKEDEIKKFKEENIKGNELFFIDLKELVKIPGKLNRQLNQIKKKIMILYHMI